jgi:hypothetical protein
MMKHAGGTPTAALLFFMFQCLYALTTSGNAFRIPDEFEVYFQVEHLVDSGDLSVPQTLAIRQPVVVDGRVVGAQSIFFGKVGIDGKPYAPYGPLVAILALPHHLAGRALAWFVDVPRLPQGQGGAWTTLVGGVTTLSSATGAALAVAGFYRAAVALATPASVALVFSLLLGGATVLWPYGTTLYSEAWQAAAFVWCAAFLLEARSGKAPVRSRVVAAAVCLTMAGLVKVTALVFAPAFIVAVLCERSVPARARREVAMALALGIMSAAAVHILWNQYRFAQPFDFGYDWSETIPLLPPRAFVIDDIPRGLVVLLLSPGKSVFLWAPVLVLAAARMPRFWLRERSVAIGVAAAFVTGLLFFSSYLFPEGGYGHGPRNLVPLVPLLLLPALGVNARARSYALAACGIAGLAVAIPAISVSFLQDQAMAAPSASSRPGYYEQIEPAPGRAANRYHLGYVPFVAAVGSPGWATPQVVGLGPDFFPRHLNQARRTLRDGQAIPEWLAWSWVIAWSSGFALAGWALCRRRRAP